MGALPKNKITSAERGKRRAGNTPNLRKQASHTTIPLSKRGFVAQLMQTLGLSKTQTQSTVTSDVKTQVAKEKASTAVKAPVQKKAIATGTAQAKVQKSATARRAGKG